jgi:hypothetical protein
MSKVLKKRYEKMARQTKKENVKSYPKRVALPGPKGIRKW